MDDLSSRPRRKRRNRFKIAIQRRLRRVTPSYWVNPILLAVVFGFCFLLWLLPTLVGHTPLISWIAQKVAADVNGRVEVSSASLGWFSPLRLYGVRIVAPDGEPVVEVAEARGDRVLTAILWNATHVGRFRLAGPKFNVVLHDQGSNLEEVFAKYLAPRDTKPIDVALEIVDGTVSLTDARHQRSWQVDQFALELTKPADRSRPWELKTSGVVSGGPRGGSFEVAMKIQQIDRLAAAAAADPEARPREGEGAGPDWISVKAEGLSLALFEPLARRFAPGLRMAGRLSAVVEGRWDVRRPDRHATLKTTVVAEDVQLAGPMFRGDQPSLARARLDGAAAWKDGVVQFDRVTAESEIGLVSLSGTFDPSGRASVQQGYELNGRLDLPRLAAMFPNTLRIHKDAKVTSGRVQWGLTSQPGPEGMVWKGRFEVADLKATNGGRPVIWQQPVLVAWAARETAQGVVVENLQCDSSFLKFQASGTPSELTGTATFDAGKLAEQLRGFSDLGGTQLAGDGWARVHWKRAADGAFDAGAQVRLNGFRWALPERPAWTEDALTLTFSATGRTASWVPNRLDTAVAKFESGSDLVEVRLMEPATDFRAGGPWSLEIHSRGQLGRWPGRLAVWLPSKTWSAGGTYELVTGATLAPQGITLRQLRFTAENLDVTGPELAVREPKVELTLTGRWEGQTRRLELETASAASASLTAQANRFVCAVPPTGPVELSGTLTYQAALDRIRAWTAADPKAPPSWRMAGRLGGKAEFQQSAGLISGRIDGQIADLDIVHASGQRYQEREVRFAAQGNYNSVSQQIHIEQVELASATVRCTASGKVLRLGTQPDLQLAGRIDYDMDRFSQFLRSMAGEGVRLGGRGSSPFSYQGVWGSEAAVASAKVGWSWAQLYGFQLGAGELEASLSKGALEIRPLDLECNEGRLRVAPQLVLAREPKELALAPGRAVDHVRITPAMCASLLQYIAPLLAGVTSAEGRFSIDLDSFRLPFARRATQGGSVSTGPVNWWEAEIAGKLVIHSAQIGPGFLIQQLAQLFGRTTPAYLVQESTIPFQLSKGRVQHQQMDLVFNEVKLRTYGSVGLDQSLSMMIEMPVPPAWQTGKILGTALKDQIIQLPISGTLRQPRIDRTAFDQIARQFLQNATQNVIKNRLGELLGPPQKR
mgnify:CR=1 FL=1